MKKFWCVIIFLVSGMSSVACPVCEQQQPKLLRGITHGTGPSGNWDYVIIIAAVLVVLATLFYTIKWLIKPGETESSHIKRTILNFN